MQDPDAPKEPSRLHQALRFLLLEGLTAYLFYSLLTSALFGILVYFSTSTLELICYGIPLLIVAMFACASIYFRRMAKARESRMEAEIRLHMERDHRHRGT